MGERTPGPWEVRHRDSLIPSHMIMAPGKDTPIAIIRMMGPDTDDYDESEEIANARFIAAAPDMEKALETAAYVLEHYLDYTQNDMAVMAEDARATLAKARGQVTE